MVIEDDVPIRELDAGLQIRLAIARKKSMPVDIIAKKKKTTHKGGSTQEQFGTPSLSKFEPIITSNYVGLIIKLF